MTERLPPPTDHTPEQREAAKAFEAQRGHAPFGPFATLLHSPELMLRASALGEYLRFRSSFEPRLSELAIVIVAAEYRQPVEWAIHQPIALKAGVSAAIVDAIAHLRRPKDMAADETALYNFVIELVRDKTVSDPVYDAAHAAFGKKGVLDLAGIAGYYGLLAMAMNTARTAPPDGPRLPPLATSANP